MYTGISSCSHILKKENVESLAILISWGDEDQLVDTSQVENNRKFNVAGAVFSELKKWGT